MRVERKGREEGWRKGREETELSSRCSFPASFRERVAHPESRSWAEAARLWTMCGLHIWPSNFHQQEWVWPMGPGHCYSVQGAGCCWLTWKWVFQSTEPIAGSWIAQQPWLCCWPWNRRSPWAGFLGHSPWGGGGGRADLSWDCLGEETRI